MLLVGAESLIPLPYRWWVNRSISTEDWDKHNPPCRRWGTITTHCTCFITVCPIPFPYLSSLPFFPHYFHHLCLSRNYYKLISCKWSRLQTWGRVGAWCQSAFTNLHPTSDPTAPQDWLSGGQNHSSSQQERKCHVPVSLSSAEGMYWPNSHVLWKMNLSSYFLDFEGICYVTDIVQSQRSSQLRWEEEKISLGRSHTSGIEICRAPHEFTNEENHIQHFPVTNISPWFWYFLQGEKIDLNLNLVYVSTSKLNVSRKNILLARSVWANYRFYPPITSTYLGEQHKNSCIILYTITIFYVLLYL